MTDISVVILVGNEALHIKRCLEKFAPLEPRQVFVVESQKGDRTHDVAIDVARHLQWQVKVKGEEGGNSTLQLQLPTTTTLHLIWHNWPGLQSTQFNWALDNLPIQSTWVLRLDADECLTPDTIKKIKQFLCSPSPSTFTSGNEVAGLTLELKRRFCGGEIRHATTGIRQVRMFRRGKGRYAETLMDERIVVGEWEKVKGEGEGEQWKLVAPGSVIDFDGAFYDDNLNDMDWWREKHRGYATREAAQAIESMESGHWVDPRKASYYKLPPYLRAFLYFAIRYFLKGGFLDGYAGWMWNFWQGLWYRCLVDHEIKALKHSHL